MPPNTPQQEQEYQGELYHTIKDASGQDVTILSANGQLRSDADFGRALKNHNTGQPTPGFVVQPTGSYSEGLRKGLYQLTREAMPQAGETLGGAVPSKMLELAVKAGLVTPQTQASAAQTGASIGKNVADVVGQQVDTPGDLGLMAGTAFAAPFAAPVVSGAGGLLKANALLRNPLLFGTAGAIGSTGAKALTGEGQTAVSGAQEFATAALGGGLQGLVGFTLTKLFKPPTATKVATEMMDAIYKKYPSLVNNPDAFSIANATPKDISNLTSMMSKALRGDAVDEAAQFVATLKTTLPSVPTVAQQNTLRMHNRKLIEAQNTALDNIGDTVKFNEALPAIRAAKEELIGYVRSIYPKVKNIDPAIVRVEEVLARQSDFAESLKEGATVLHHLKQSGAAEKFNPMEFAQRIRGSYTEEPGSLLNQVGDILRQKGSLKELPLPGEAEPGGEMGKKAFNLMRQLVPKGEAWTNALKYTGPPTPWPTPQGPPTAQVIAAQQAGQAAMKEFLSRREKKWSVKIP